MRSSEIWNRKVLSSPSTKKSKTAVGVVLCQPRVEQLSQLFGRIAFRVEQLSQLFGRNVFRVEQL